MMVHFCQSVKKCEGSGDDCLRQGGELNERLCTALPKAGKGCAKICIEWEVPAQPYPGLGRAVLSDHMVF